MNLQVKQELHKTFIQHSVLYDFCSCKYAFFLQLKSHSRRGLKTELCQYKAPLYVNGTEAMTYTFKLMSLDDCTKSFQRGSLMCTTDYIRAALLASCFNPRVMFSKKPPTTTKEQSHIYSERFLIQKTIKKLSITLMLALECQLAVTHKEVYIVLQCKVLCILQYVYSSTAQAVSFVDDLGLSVIQVFSLIRL